MFLEVDPQGESIYSEIFQMYPPGLRIAIPLRPQGILHQSHLGDSEESHLIHGSPRISCRLTTSVVSLLTPCHWEVKRPGGMWVEKGGSEEQVKGQPAAGWDTEKHCVVEAVPSLAVGL